MTLNDIIYFGIFCKAQVDCFRIQSNTRLLLIKGNELLCKDECFDCFRFLKHITYFPQKCVFLYQQEN